MDKKTKSVNRGILILIVILVIVCFGSIFNIINYAKNKIESEANKNVYNNLKTTTKPTEIEPTDKDLTRYDPSA